MYTLYKLPEGFIVTSDEKVEDNQLRYNPYTNTVFLFENSKVDKGVLFPLLGSLKVIAQQDQIDFSSLSEEKQKEIGWFDIQMIKAITYWQQFGNEKQQGIAYGLGLANEHYRKAQELLSDRRFTLEDMREAIVESWNSCEDNENDETFTQVFNRIIQSLSQPKSWKIEGVWENDKFKITKIK